MLVAVAALAGCASRDLAPSIWPPPDFRCEVEEVVAKGSELHVVRRVRFEGSGVVVYGTASRSLVDAETGTALPVLERLAVYELVPACIRAFSRRIDRLGIVKMDESQGERGSAADSALVLRWQAFGSEKVIMARGRVHGPMAEILAVIAAHLPPGERLALAGSAERPVVSVLRGVPEPAVDALGALRVHEALLQRHGEDREWLLDAYALACAAGLPAEARALLRRWEEQEAMHRALGGFPDEQPAGLTADVLRRLLPPQGSG